MKKILSVTTAFAVTLSLSACAMGNNRNNDINRVRYNGNGRTDITRISQPNNGNNAGDRYNAGYKDGVYTGYGVARGNTNEMAIVELRNGRIVNVNLQRVGLFRGDTDAPRGTQFNQGRPGAATNNQNRTNNQTTTRTRTTPAGDDDFVGFGNPLPNTATNDGTPMRIGTGNNTVNNNANNNLNNNRTGIGTGTVVRNGNGTGIEGTTVLSTPANLDGPRRTLIRTILREQRYDVDMTDNDPNVASTINNWELAVQNALAQARR